MAAFVHDHLSGRFTATPDEEEAAVDDSMESCHIFTTTEVGLNARARKLREAGWHPVFGNKGPRDDCGISVKKARFEVLEGATKTLSYLTYITERGERADTTEGAFVVVKDKLDGTKGVVVVVHMPHGMQDDLRLGRPGSDVAKAYRGILRGAKHLANELARLYKATWTMIVGDWNVNVKAAWVQAWLKIQFPSYHVNWARPFPKRGTWNGLIFDFALLRGIDNRRNPVLLAMQKGFDHRGWRQTLYPGRNRA